MANRVLLTSTTERDKVLFYFSFYQLRMNKVSSINNYEDPQKSVSYIKLAGANLFGVYQYGKKFIDILRELCLMKNLSSTDIVFLNKFSETRNKIIEHNFNPRGYNFLIEPIFWTLGSTDSWLEVRIHAQKEAEYLGEVDYYEDYYKLEAIITDIIKRF